jgi:hypothetical protein
MDDHRRGTSDGYRDGAYLWFIFTRRWSENYIYFSPSVDSWRTGVHYHAGEGPVSICTVSQDGHGSLHFTYHTSEVPR